MKPLELFWEVTEMTLEHAKQIRALIVKASASLPDEDALNAAELFPFWASGLSFSIGDRVCYKQKLYKCVQAHTSQADWTPDATPALWVEVAKPGAIPDWKQPAGAHDAYKKGDLVRHNGEIWESTTDSNVWEPGVYGWVKK